MIRRDAPLLLTLALSPLLVACGGDKDSGDTDETDAVDTGGLDPNDDCDPWVSADPLEGLPSLDGLDDEAFRAQLQTEAVEDGLCRWVDATCRGEDGFAYTAFIQGETVGGQAVFYDSFGTLVAVADYSTEACPGGFDTKTTWYGERLTGCTLETLGAAVGPCERRCDQLDTEAGDTDGCDDTVATGTPATGAQTLVGDLGLGSGDERVVARPNASAVDVATIGAGDTLRLTGPVASRFGESVVVADVTGDGTPDLVVGAPQAQLGRGRVYVFEGPLSSTTALGDALAEAR